MAEDHFVPQTYLDHWCDPGTNKLRGYKKASGESFPCATKDVCREWNWDINPRFNDNLIGEFRKIFERAWNPTVRAIRSGSISSVDKFVVAGHWALLTTCTPIWLAHAVELFRHHVLDLIPLAADHVQERDDFEKVVAEMKRDVDPNEVKRMLTQQLHDRTIMLHKLDWIVFENSTEVPFITSDNPSSICPRRTITTPLTRFLPLARDLAIMAKADPTKPHEGLVLPDLHQPAPGTIRRRVVNRKQAVRLNRITVMNADQLVLSSAESRGVRRLVHNHRRFGLAIERVKMSVAGRQVVASTLVIRQKSRA